MNAPRSGLMSVKTDLVKEMLVGEINGVALDHLDETLPPETEAALRGAPFADAAAGSLLTDLGVELAKAGYFARVVERELFALAREPTLELEALLRRAAQDVDGGHPTGDVSARLAEREPIERPDPGDERAMTWVVPGPGGHVRHYVALSAIEALASRSGASVLPEHAGNLKRCWLYGFFLRCCEETAPPAPGSSG